MIFMVRGLAAGSGRFRRGAGGVAAMRTTGAGATHRVLYSVPRSSPGSRCWVPGRRSRTEGRRSIGSWMAGCPGDLAGAGLRPAAIPTEVGRRSPTGTPHGGGVIMPTDRMGDHVIDAAALNILNCGGY